MLLNVLLCNIQFIAKGSNCSVATVYPFFNTTYALLRSDAFVGLCNISVSFSVRIFSIIKFVSKYSTSFKFRIKT